MRGYVPAYTVCTPRSLSEALALVSDSCRPLAGGTDLMVLLETGTLEHKQFMNLMPLPELRSISATPTEIFLGALTTFRQIQDNPTIAKEFPALREAARSIGAIAIQNRGTLGGNIANASPAADSPPALLAHDARIELVSKGGSRWVPYSDFHTGYKKTVMRSDELIKTIALPRNAVNGSSGPWAWYYRKVGTRNAQAISKVCFAGRASVAAGAIQDIRLALGSVAPTVVRCLKTEAVLRGRTLDRKAIVEAKDALAREIAPIDDIRSNAGYRLRVSLNLLEEFLLSVQTGKCHVELGR